MLIQDSNILITGGTGSFGHRVAAQLLELRPNRITIFSRDEKKQHQMARLYSDFRFVLGDVRDYESVESAMRGIDMVFHAAALKQVPNCEEWPLQAVATNVHGSYNVCRAAMWAGAQSVVALSTDKAVKPINAMGMTKALMEKIVGQFGRCGSDTRFCCVRYGNVLGSRGSVLPVFREQIFRGGPITLTSPYMTRFLLTLDEAVELVFYALENAGGGEVFVRKAPACTMATLAQAMVERYGTTPVEIRTVGSRVGEKVHEVLINEFELPTALDRGHYFVVPPPEPRQLSGPDVGPPLEYTSENTRRISDIAELISIIELVDPDAEPAI